MKKETTLYPHDSCVRPSLPPLSYPPKGAVNSYKKMRKCIRNGEKPSKKHIVFIKSNDNHI